MKDNVVGNRECPQCGNKQLILHQEELIGKDYSVLTGKLLKNYGYQGVNCWDYKCKCGWRSEIFTD